MSLIYIELDHCIHMFNCLTRKSRKSSPPMSRACAVLKSLKDFRGSKCYVGVDLSSGGDLTSIAIVIPYIVDGVKKYFVHTHSFANPPRPCHGRYVLSESNSQEHPHQTQESDSLSASSPACIGHRLKQDQANIVFEEIVKFINSDEDLSEWFKVHEHNHTIDCLITHSEIKALSGDTKSLDGHRAYLGIVDEYHAHKTNTGFPCCNVFDIH